MPTLNINGNIRTNTAAGWAADATVYSGKTILITTNALYTGTDQRKFKIADGAQTWTNLDYFPDIIALIGLIGLSNVLSIAAKTNEIPITSNDTFSSAELLDGSAWVKFNNGVNNGYSYHADDASEFFHNVIAYLNAPDINLPNETASRYLYLDSSKNIDTKTNAQVLSDIGSDLSTASRPRKIFASQNTNSSITGTTTQTILANISIPAGSMGANDAMRIMSQLFSLGTAGTKVFRMYISTVSNDFSAATQIATVTQGAANPTLGEFSRTMVNKNSQSVNEIFPAAVNAATQAATSTSAATTVNANFATQLYLIITCVLANTGDTGVLSNIQVYIDKP